MPKLKLNVYIQDRAEPTKYEDLDPGITANELVEKIKQEEEAQKFTFGKWYNDLDQEIFMYGLDDGSRKIADLLWVDDFSKWHDIALRHKTAGSNSSLNWDRFRGIFIQNKFTLMNATHEKLFFEVRYAAESQRVRHKQEEKNFGLGVSVGEIGGNFDVGWQSDVRKEVNYIQDLSKAEEYDLDAHCSKKVTVNKGHFTGVIYVEVFQVDKNKEKIVTRTNNEGWKMGAETISLCCGEHYIILPGCDGEIQSVVSGNRWTSKNGNIYEPHGCLKKEVRCPKCDFLTQRDGWMCGKQNFKDIHPRAGLARVNDEFSRCQLRCGFQIKPIFDDD